MSARPDPSGGYHASGIPTGFANQRALSGTMVNGVPMGLGAHPLE